ncbi:helix-turn-helix domain-containing protein [Prauserella cavernicola]|uniref:Helix-turn-helix domain-containing protein n=1 Tax=Prauserella cavernicola TaxID=2800127 RepID=A0A934V7I5_9PSEU|nr:helix-turn-helix domain-containing protein [Prauserella cavernicola]MBK1787285.1 helix-turn-helix domain-containing protein [Prauserella cavernicola]
MASDLQRLIDNLGRRLARSVAIDDRYIRLLAYNSHVGAVDEIRIESIMRREVSSDLVRYIQGLGMLEANDLFRVPANPALGLTLDRIGMPVRVEGAVVGVLWLLASDGPLSDDHADAVRQAAEHAAQILHREYLFDELRRGRERELLRDLLSGDPHLHGEAAQLLIEEELLMAGPAVAIVATVSHEQGQPLPENDRLGLAAGLEQCRRRVSPRTAVHLERADHGVLVVVQAERSTTRDIDEVAAVAHERIRAETGRDPQDCQVGIGTQRRGLGEVHASYTEARRAMDVARVVPVHGAVVRFSRLGVFGLLAELPPAQLARNIHPGLHRLLEYDADGSTLTGTLEAFLNNAGDVRRTAAELNIHRASVHYRLRRIEEIAGVDLSDGNDRLDMHVGLKVAQLVQLR